MNSVPSDSRESSSEYSVSSCSSSTSDLMSLSSYSVTSPIDFDFIETVDDKTRSETNNHYKLFTSEEMDKIKRDLIMISWMSQQTMENYFVDNKLIDYGVQDQISVFLNDPVVTTPQAPNNPVVKPTKQPNKLMRYLSRHIRSISDHSSAPNSSGNSDSTSNNYGFRHFNDWKSHLIYFKLIKGYAHNQHIVRKCCRMHANTAALNNTLEADPANPRINELFYAEHANVYENVPDKNNKNDGFDNTQVSTRSSNSIKKSQNLQLEKLSEHAIEFSSKMSNLERILNSTQLGPNNLIIGPINKHTKIRDNGHLHHMYNSTNTGALESTIDAFISSKKLRNSEFYRYNEHSKIEQNVRKFVDSLTSAHDRSKNLSQLYSDPIKMMKSERQLHKHNIHFSSKQIKQFNNNSLHFTPNLIAGILGEGSKSANPVNTLIHDVLTKANDSFFMPNLEKETARNIQNISSTRVSKKSRKRVIAFYHRVNENEYGTGSSKQSITNKLKQTK